MVAKTSPFADFKSWERRFFSFISASGNRLIERTFERLCKTGCKEEALLNALWECSAGRIDPSAARNAHRKVAASVKQFRAVANHLSQAADQWATIKQSQGDVAGFHSSFISGLDRAWGDFGRRLNSEAE